MGRLVTDHRRKPSYKVQTPLRDPSVLWHEYVIKGKSRKQLAFEYGLKENFVKELIAILPKRSTNRGRFERRYHFDSSTLEDLYHEKQMTIQEIALQTETSAWVVQDAMKRYGIMARQGVAKQRGIMPTAGKKASMFTRIKQSAIKQGIHFSEWTSFAERRDNRKRSYKEWRKSVLKRDNWKCKMCPESKGTLHAHHIVKYSLWKEGRYCVDNGITLCKRCHQKTYGKETQFETFFKETVRNYEIYSLDRSGTLYGRRDYFRYLHPEEEPIELQNVHIP